MGRLKKLKKIRIHREGTHILWGSFLLLLLINAALYWGIDCKIPFYVVAVASIVVYLLMVNFFRCPIRLFGQDTEKIVVAPADGKIVVIEEVDENEYFHDRRLMVSIFMSPGNSSTSCIWCWDSSPIKICPKFCRCYPKKRTISLPGPESNGRSMRTSSPAGQPNTDSRAKQHRQ